jgi:anti-sigma regulatory factor (Ser/Thr protein kinase)/PAS domain-containing protein
MKLWNMNKFQDKSILIILCSIFIFSATCAYAEEINLNKKSLYIKKGFSLEWIESIPEKDPSWMHIAPSQTGFRSVRIADLDMPGIPRRTFLSLKTFHPETFTLVTSFDIPDETFIKNNFLGLYIKMIAENWEIYLNGSLLRKEIFLNPDGSIKLRRDLRDSLTYINPHLLRPGKNILAYRIIGDPTIVDTGFYTNAPIIISDYEKLARKKSEYFSIILICIYLMVGLYHLLLYLNRRSERYNLFFGLFSIILFMYLLNRTSAINSIFFDTYISHTIEFCSLYISFPLFLYFMDYILFNRTKIFVHAYGVFSLFLVIVSLVTGYSFKIDILRVWQYSTILPLSYFVIFQIGRAFLANVRAFRKSGGADGGIATMKAIGKTIAKTVPGNLLAGALVAVGCTVFDILDSLYLGRGLLLTNYGFVIFVLGITLVLTNRFDFLYSKIDGLNLDLRQKSSDLTETRVMYGISQEKYRLLVEGSTDIIFSMDENFRFLTANRTMLNLLSFSEAELYSKRLPEVIHDTDDRSVTAQFVQEKLDRFLKDKEPLHLKLDFKIPFGIEPVSMQIRLEFINIEGRNEIFGRGTSVADDALTTYLDSERQHYRIGNLLLVADDLSYRITRNLLKYIDKKEHNMIRIAIREMIINAIEHGNLAITFDEKTKEMGDDNYFTYLNERQKDPRFKGRTVAVDYLVNSEKVEYIITDQGRGFDYQKYLQGDIEANEAMLAHGRGIALAKNIFDEIRYNDTGNQVSLVKHLRKNS